MHNIWENTWRRTLEQKLGEMELLAAHLMKDKEELISRVEETEQQLLEQQLQQQYQNQCHCLSHNSQQKS